MKKKKSVMIIIAAVLCLCLSALTGCSSGSIPEQSGAPESTGSSPQSGETEAEKETYRWDINGDMEMHWQTNDDYRQYVQIAEEACPIGAVGDQPVVSMRAIFPSWEGWPMETFSHTDVTPWHFDTEADLGEEAEDKGETFTIWGNLQNPVNQLTGYVSSIEHDLSYYLGGERAKSANEGTLVTSGLRTREVNGMTVKYVRMQFEYDHHDYKTDETEVLFVQRTKAMIPVETDDGTFYLDVMIDEFRSDPSFFSDDSIIDVIFENVVMG